MFLCLLLCWPFLAGPALLQSWCPGFSSLWLLLLRNTGPRVLALQQSRRVGSVAVAHKLNSWRHGLRGSEAFEILPGSGVEPMSSAPAGGFFTTVPTGEARPSNIRVVNSASFLPLLRAWVPWPWCTSPLRGVGMTNPRYPRAGNCAGLWICDSNGVSAAESCLIQWQRVVDARHSERGNLCQLVLCPCVLTKQYSTFADSSVPLPCPSPRPRNQCGCGPTVSQCSITACQREMLSKPLPP